MYLRKYTALKRKTHWILRKKIILAFEWFECINSLKIQNREFSPRQVHHNFFLSFAVKLFRPMIEITIERCIFISNVTFYFWFLWISFPRSIRMNNSTWRNGATVKFRYCNERVSIVEPAGSGFGPGTPLEISRYFPRKLWLFPKRTNSNRSCSSSILILFLLSLNLPVEKCSLTLIPVTCCSVRARGAANPMAAWPDAGISRDRARGKPANGSSRLQIERTSSFAFTLTCSIAATPVNLDAQDERNPIDNRFFFQSGNQIRTK